MNMTVFPEIGGLRETKKLNTAEPCSIVCPCASAQTWCWCECVILYNINSLKRRKQVTAMMAFPMWCCDKT